MPTALNKNKFVDIFLLLFLITSIFVGYCLYKNNSKKQNTFNRDIKIKKEEKEKRKERKEEEEEERKEKSKEEIFLIDNLSLSYLTTAIILIISSLILLNRMKKSHEKPSICSVSSVWHLQGYSIDVSYNRKAIKDVQLNSIRPEQKERVKNKSRLQTLERVVLALNILKVLCWQVVYIFFCLLFHFLFSLIGSGIAKIKSSLSYGYLLKKSFFHPVMTKMKKVFIIIFNIIILIFIFYFFDFGLIGQETANNFFDKCKIVRDKCSIKELSDLNFFIFKKKEEEN